MPLLLVGNISSGFNPHCAVDIFAGGTQSALLDASGDVWLWGRNQFGYSVLQSGPLWTPMKLDRMWGASTNLTLSMGPYHTLVLDRSSGIAWAYGRNDYGQLGLSAAPFQKNVTVLSRVLGKCYPAPRWVQVCAGQYHSLFLDDNGTVWSAGSNGFGQLGVPDWQPPQTIGNCTSFSFFTVTLDASVAQTVSAMTCGDNHAIVLTFQSMLYSFGSNLYGQLLSSVNAGNANQNLPALIDSLLFDGDSAAASPELPVAVWCRGDSSFVQTERSACVPGSFSPDGLQPCINCSAGSSATVTQAESSPCLRCAAGTYSMTGASVCLGCEMGTYSGDIGSSACTTCPLSRPKTAYPSSASLSDCISACAPGSAGPGGGPLCTSCASGSYSSADEMTFCTECEIGKYQQNQKQTSCVQCPSNQSTLSVGQNTSQACRQICPKGEYSSTGLSDCSNCTCALCDAGTYQDLEHSTTCILCPIDTFSESPGSTSCQACPQNTGTGGNGSSQAGLCYPFCLAGFSSTTGLNLPTGGCSLCSAGTVASAPRATACAHCSVGLYSSGSASACVSCSAGKYASVEGSLNCSYCAPGKYSSGSSGSSCNECQIGYFANVSGMSVCVNCPALLSTNGTGASSISSCAAYCNPGYYSASGMAECSACPAGSMSTSIGSKSCNPCIAGTFSTVNMTVCSICKAGTYSVAGMSVCSPCSAGNMSIAGQSVCSQCPTGYFGNSSGQSACYPCPANYFQNSLGSTGCNACGLGYLSSGAAVVCQACPTGTFGNASGCSFCRPGTYQSGVAATSCTTCQPGKFITSSGSPGQGGCLPCTAGQVNSITGASSCAACLPGTYSNSAKTACVNCLAGTYTPSSSSNDCSNCPPGTFQSSTGMSVCSNCGPGFFSILAWTACQSCPQGSYSSLASNSVCYQCIAGKSTDGSSSNSASACRTVCLNGTFGFDGLAAYGENTCPACAPGQFSMGKINLGCLDCTPGTYSGQQASSCSLCLAGFISQVGASACMSCTPGKYIDFPGFFICIPCDLGTYSSGYGSSSCMDCVTGKYSPSGSSACFACPLGTEPITPSSTANKSTQAGCESCPVGMSSNGTQCLLCPKNHFNSKIGASACELCPVGYGSNLEGLNASSECIAVCTPGSYSIIEGLHTVSVPCHLCSVGMFQPYFKQSSCLLCPPGQFSNMSGASVCQSCEINTFTELPGQHACTSCPNNTFTFQTGASNPKQCRIAEAQQCAMSPRHYGIYPIYPSGSNDFGETIHASMVDRNGVEVNLPQLILCNSLSDWEPIWFVTSGRHTFVQTAYLDLSNPQTLSVTKLWSFGLNDYGQLGSSINLQDNLEPVLVPTILFPDLPSGNSISSALQNNNFYFWQWDSVSMTRKLHSVSLPDGLYGPLDINRSLAFIAQTSGLPSGWVQLEYDEVGQGVILSVQAPGFQVDLTFNNTFRSLLGFDSPVKIPPDAIGTLNEISDLVSNNILTYRVWCYSWPACSTYRDVTIILPSAIYDIYTLTAEISKAVSENGDDIDAIEFLVVQKKVCVLIGMQGIQLLFRDSKLGITTLGLANTNLPPWGPWNQTLVVAYYSVVDRPFLSSEWSPNAEAEITDINAETSMSAGQWPISVSLGLEHTLILTESRITGKRRLWSLGSNMYGQLGIFQNAGANKTNAVPVLLSEFDEVNGGLRITEIQSGAYHNMVQTYDGNTYVFGSNRYNQLGPNILTPASFSLSPMLFLPSFANPVNEISSASKNNALIYNYLSGSILISSTLGNNRLHFAAWEKTAQTTVQYSQTIPDGTYTPSQLATAINNAIYSSTGLTNAVVLSSPNAGLDNPIAITLKYTGVKIFTTAADSFFTGNNSLGLPGGVDFPDPALYSGSRVPDEVSAAAGNNLFLYRYGANVFNVTIPAGIYNLSDIEAYISKGMVQNGQPSGVFRFSIDSESRVVLEITQPSFQALFSARSGVKYFNNTVGRYLGFLEMDLPCNPANIVPMLTEQDVISGQFVPTGPFCIDSVASPSSEAQISCLGPQNMECGLTSMTAGKIFRKAAAYSRPLVSFYSARGECYSAEDVGDCACHDGSPFFSYINESESDVSQPASSPITCGNCSCALNSYIWSQTAQSRWGVRQYTVKVPDLLYNALNFGVIDSSFQSYFSSLSHWLTVNIFLDVVSESISLSLEVTGPGGYQIDLSSSSLSVALGLGNGTFPSENQFAFKYSCNITHPCVVLSTIASWKYLYGGVVLSDFSLGRDHTIVQTLDKYTGEMLLYAWGSNQYGQLGTEENAGMCIDKVTNETLSCAVIAARSPTSQPVLHPVSSTFASLIPQALFDGEVLQVEAGGLHNLILTSSGKMWCFGSNQYGQCGFDQNADPNTQVPNPLPILVGTRSNGPDNYPPDSNLCSPVANRTALLCTVAVCNEVDPCGKWDFIGQCVDCPFDGMMVQDFRAGLSHSVVQTVDGRMWSFGSNSLGQLVQTNLNLGNQNANPQPAEVSANTFGDGNQPILGIWAGGNVTLVQTFRPLCAPGNFSIDGRSPCERCEPGSFDDSVGLWTKNLQSVDQSLVQPLDFADHLETPLNPKNLSCYLCPAGKYSSAPSSTTCLSCWVGTYSMLGASACHICPAGTFSDSAEAPFTNRTSCRLCPAGQSSLAGTSTCFICQAGSASSYDGSPKCTICSAGSFSNTSAATTCTLCPTASYQNVTGGTFCYHCFGNSTTAALGASSSTQCVSLCEPGQAGSAVPVGSAYGNSNCQACLAGKFSNSSRSDGKGASSCGLCSAGKKFSPRFALYPYFEKCAFAAFCSPFSRTKRFSKIMSLQELFLSRMLGPVASALQDNSHRLHSQQPAHLVQQARHPRFPSLLA